MVTYALPQQRQGELVAPETVRGIAHAIAEAFHPERIVLFGSYATGRPSPDSDVDLLVVMPSTQPQHRRAAALRMLFRPAPCAMDILVFTPDEVRRWNGTANHIVTEAFTHGKVLHDSARP